MRNGIPEFRARQPLERQLSAATFNDIRRELESLRITRVVNGTFRKLPGGTEIVVAPSSGGGLGSTRQPWDLIVRKNPDNDQEYLIRVQIGTLNNRVATNWDDEWAVPTNDQTLRYAAAKIATDGENITGISLVFGEEEPEEQEPTKFGLAEEIDYLFGLFYKGSVYRTTNDGNIVLSPRVWLTVDSEPPAAPGESPYDIYYLLQP
jgi:hypothetical protein